MLRLLNQTASLFALFLVAGFCSGSLANVITVTNGEVEGEWGVLERCPAGSRALSYQTQNDLAALPGFADDTALNSIMLICNDPDQTNLTSATGISGTWEAKQSCILGSYLTGFKLLVEEINVNNTDNTAANNIAFRCSNGREISGRGNTKGTWGDWSAECPAGICGIETRVRTFGGANVDDTALNDVRFTCCDEAHFRAHH